MNVNRRIAVAFAAMVSISGAIGFTLGFTAVGLRAAQGDQQLIDALDKRALADGYPVCPRAARLLVNQRSRVTNTRDLNQKAFLLQPILLVQGRKRCLELIVALQVTPEFSSECQMTNDKEDFSQEYAACLLGYKIE